MDRPVFKRICAYIIDIAIVDNESFKKDNIYKETFKNLSDKNHNH